MSELPRFKTPFVAAAALERSRSSSPETDPAAAAPLPWKIPKRLSVSFTGDNSRKPSVASFHGDLVKEQTVKKQRKLWKKALTIILVFLFGSIVGALIGYYAIPRISSSTSSMTTIVTADIPAVSAVSGFGSHKYSDGGRKAGGHWGDNNGDDTRTGTPRPSSTSSTTTRRTLSTTSSRPTTLSTTTSRRTSTTTTSSTSKSATPTSAGTKTFWQPTSGTKFQIVLSSVISAADAAKIPSTYTAYDTDLFDTPASTISILKANGKKVICYFSAGTGEDWRSDYGSFQAADIGGALGGWPGEKWLDTRSANVRKVMTARLQMAADKGCDGVDPDNVDVYNYADAGFPLTKATTIDYLTFLANAAHAKGLAIGLKNAGEVLAAVQPLFQYSITESCVNYDECSIYQPFTTAGKPSFHIQYPFADQPNGDSMTTVTADVKKTYCSGSTAQMMLKHRTLDSWIYQC